MNVVTFIEYRPGPRYDGQPWTQVRIEESDAASGPWTIIDTQALDPLDADPTNPQVRDFTTENATLERGWYRVAFLDGNGDIQLVDPIPYPATLEVALTAPTTNVRSLIPRVRRAVEGVGAAAVLSNDAVKDLIADSIASIILYTGSVFGKKLEVTSVDADTGAPSEYATSEPLTLEEGTVVAAQAALDFFFFRFAGLKTSETIQDEAGTWTYELSANLLVQQLKLLVGERDKALYALEGELPSMDSYVSFVAERDVQTARYVEPWVDGAGGLGGLLTAGGVVLEPDYRFGGVG